MQPDYKETMNAMFKKHGVNPDLFVGYRVDSGANPFAPKLVPIENHAPFIKPNFPSANMPIEKFSDFGCRRVLDRLHVNLVKKHYQFDILPRLKSCDSGSCH